MWLIHVCFTILGECIRIQFFVKIILLFSNFPKNDFLCDVEQENT